MTVTEAATQPTDAQRFGHILQVQRAAYLRDGAPSLAARRSDLNNHNAALIARRSAIEEATNTDFGHRSRHETAMMELLGVVQGIASASSSVTWTRFSLAADARRDRDRRRQPRHAQTVEVDPGDERCARVDAERGLPAGAGHDRQRRRFRVLLLAFRPSRLHRQHRGRTGRDEGAANLRPSSPRDTYATRPSPTSSSASSSAAGRPVSLPTTPWCTNPRSTPSSPATTDW
jgi:hypothetical protein